ncbi:RusA family crossover junction endodeoxyribonuclease [Nitrospira sp. M1]
MQRSLKRFKANCWGFCNRDIQTCTCRHTRTKTQSRSIYSHPSVSRPIYIHSLKDFDRKTSVSRHRPSKGTTSRLSARSFSAVPDTSLICRITPRELTLTLPIPPSINQQYATVNGRRILSSKSRQYKTLVAQQILSTLTFSPNRTALQHNLNTHSLILSVRFYFTTALRRDLDGGLKISQDAICNALGINDNRITEIHLYKSVDAASPRIECTLSIHQPTPLPRQKSKTPSTRKKN